MSRSDSQRDIDGLAKSITSIVRRLCKVQREARALGIFTGERELLTCPQCGLMEDVLIDGQLVTCREGSEGQDTGVRFVESHKRAGTISCPACGSDVVGDAEIRRRTRAASSRRNAP